METNPNPYRNDTGRSEVETAEYLQAMANYKQARKEFWKLWGLALLPVLLGGAVSTGLWVLQDLTWTSIAWEEMALYTAVGAIGVAVLCVIVMYDESNPDLRFRAILCTPLYLLCAHGIGLLVGAAIIAVLVARAAMAVYDFCAQLLPDTSVLVPPAKPRKPGSKL